MGARDQPCAADVEQVVVTESCGFRAESRWSRPHWRVADAINRAIWLWLHQLQAREAREWLQEGRVDCQLASQLIAYVNRRHLAVRDFDNVNGPLALRALADVLAVEPHLLVLEPRLYIGDGWADVERSAHYLLQMEPRRYQAEHEVAQAR